MPGVRFGNSYNFTTPQFVLKAKKNDLALNRFGVVVSKKIDKRAVERNRIKRMFRDVLSDLCVNMLSGHDILYIVRIGIVNKTKEEIQVLIKDSLQKAKLIK
ncbi:MAG: ribonuclease P protein component [bacterium]|nr:ribonuclease P protein component [bacterium]